MKKWLLLFFIFKTGIASGQNPIGLPNITSYSRSVYGGGLQNRSITQDKNGILYFANSDGLLSFDGTYWKLYPLPNKTMVRCVTIGADGKIYAGGQNEMGYFSPDRNGSLVYTSLKSLIPQKNIAFRDVWNVLLYRGDIFFRSTSGVFQFDGKTVKVYPPASAWQYLGVSNDRLLGQDEKKGLLKFSNGQWEPVDIKTPVLFGNPVTGIIPFGKDSTLIATLKTGLFVLSGAQVTPFKIKGTDPFLTQQIMCALALDHGQFGIGTHMGGCYIIDKTGQIIQNFTRREGLQNNTVIGLFSDRDHNLWMGLDVGVDFAAYNSAIKHIYPERLNEGEGYSATVFDHRLYIGTSNWLYHLPITGNGDLSATGGTFKHVEGTKGSAWGLSVIDNNLLLAHHEGAFQIKNGVASPVNNHTGYWTFNSYSSSPNASLIIAGSYNGLDLFGLEGGEPRQKATTSFNESARFLVTDGHIVWVAHSYKGIFKVDLRSPDHAVSKLYTEKDGLPTVLRDRVFKIKGQMVVATEKGIYQYDAKSDRFEPSAYYKGIFGTIDLRYLREDASGNIWFIEKNKLGVAELGGKTPKLVYLPELTGELVSDFENIYPLDEQNIFVGAEKGFYHINYAQYKNNKPELRVLLRTVKTFDRSDTLLNGGYTTAASNKGIPKLTDEQSSLHFEYSAPSYQQQQNIEYSYFLEGVDKNWSAWSKKTEKDYTNLPAGRFSFQVKARSNLGHESVITAYSFVVLPPWYQTSWAYLLYTALLACLLYAAYRLLKKKFRKLKQRHEEEQKRLKYLYELEIEKSEKEIIVLKNEKLLAEIEGKNSELASVAMHLLQKGELLAKLREELVRLKRATTEDMQSDDLKKLIRIINQESKMDKEWDQFAVYFDNTHSDFLKAIKEAHPTLNPNELKLCAYLRMNLSSKEIAQLMNISVRGVEISRYRLRKKLGVPTEVSMFNYFAEFADAKKETV